MPHSPPSRPKRPINPVLVAAVAAGLALVFIASTGWFDAGMGAPSVRIDPPTAPLPQQPGSAQAATVLR